jgi:hypothetical protein
LWVSGKIKISPPVFLYRSGNAGKDKDKDKDKE